MSVLTNTGDESRPASPTTVALHPTPSSACPARQTPSTRGCATTPDDAPLANFLWERLGMYVWIADAVTD